MNSTYLNEHDANQGAQSSGEFLGMTGNSGWYLLGSAGVTILMVILLWGILGVSLLLCLFIGCLLCIGSVAYVFTLKNGKPAHYDTDFFESALVESGLLQFSFGPRVRRPLNPFTDAVDAEPVLETSPGKASSSRSTSGSRGRGRTSRLKAAPADSKVEDREKSKAACATVAPVVMRSEYEQLEQNLTTTEELLDEALAEAAEA